MGTITLDNPGDDFRITKNKIQEVKFSLDELLDLRNNLKKEGKSTDSVDKLLTNLI